MGAGAANNTTQVSHPPSLSEPTNSVSTFSCENRVLCDTSSIPLQATRRKPEEVVVRQRAAKPSAYPPSSPISTKSVPSLTLWHSTKKSEESSSMAQVQQKVEEELGGTLFRWLLQIDTWQRQASLAKARMRVVTHSSTQPCSYKQDTSNSLAKVHSPQASVHLRPSWPLKLIRRWARGRISTSTRNSHHLRLQPQVRASIDHISLGFNITLRVGTLLMVEVLVTQLMGRWREGYQEVTGTL